MFGETNSYPNPLGKVYLYLLMCKAILACIAP